MTNPKQLFLDVKIDKSKTLDSFIKCDSTELIYQALKEFRTCARFHTEQFSNFLCKKSLLVEISHNL